MGEISIMGAVGDTKIIWDPKSAAEVENARETFNRLVKEKKYAAFTVGERGKKDEKITQFDPELAQIILIPPIAGG